jgi:valyl-tRNA synthetase
MVMGVIKHDNAVPWHELMTAGHLLVKKGEKISKKTGGGAYDPNKLTEEHGVDAIRYAMCQAKLGTDAYFEEENVARGKKLITKLINAYRLVVMNLDANTLYQLGRIDLLDLTDRWILNKFTDTAWKIKESANKYEPALTLLILEDFFWKYFCDNYLEIAKYRLKGDDGSKMSTQKTLSYLILELLKLFSIYLPYTTEELFHSTLENGELITDSEAGFFQSLLSKNSIHSLTLTVLSISYDKELDEAGELLIEKLTEIRKAKATSGKKLSEEVDSISIFDTEENISKIRQFENELKGLGHSKEMNFQTDTISKVLVL